MTFLISYIKQKCRLILFWLVCCAVFLVTFWLYHFPLSAVCYPMIVCTILGICLLLFDYHTKHKRHLTMQKIQSNTEILLDTFPKPHDISEEDDYALIAKLDRQITEMQNQSNDKYSDIIDYYTIWAHQIKTPIASMKLTLQSEDSLLTRRLSSDLFRIAQYVEMVLTFLRLDSESTDFVFRSHSLDAILRQCVKKYSRMFIDKKLRLCYEPLDMNIVTDEKWFAFVVEQLLSNALKYTKEGSISIFMKEPQSLCISDTGIGIAASDLPRIFEKGFTGFNGRSDKSASGIGLFLCKQVCCKLGITISIESVLSKGTSVYLTFSQSDTKFE